MTTSNDPDAIRTDIERTRAQLSYNVDALGETANPMNIADRQVDRMKGAVRGVRDAVMGSPDDPSDEGQVGSLRTEAAHRASAAGDAVSSAPEGAMNKTRGNPLAAGLIAFGAGLLLSSLIPFSQKEQQLVSDLQENVEPLKQQAVDTAKEMVDNLREPAREAAESVKGSAAAAAQNVKDEGQAAKQQVQNQAEQSQAAVQDTRTS